MLGELAAAARKVAILVFWMDVVLCVFYLIFSLAGSNPVTQFFSIIGYSNLATQLSKYQKFTYSNVINSYGYMIQNPIGLWQMMITVVSLMLFGVGVITYKLFMMIPNYGPYLAYVLSPIFGLFGLGGFIYFFFCVILKRC